MKLHHVIRVSLCRLAVGVILAWELGLVDAWKAPAEDRCLLTQLVLSLMNLHAAI